VLADVVERNGVDPGVEKKQTVDDAPRDRLDRPPILAMENPVALGDLPAHA
jgi:hypothetical protein